MIKRTTTNGMKFLLVDDLNPEDVAMMSALYARSAAGAEPILERIYAARRAAFREGMSKTPCFNPKDETFDMLMDISGHNDASALARRIHNDYAVKYGHKSIADCGSTTLCCEGASMLAAKAIQDWPLYSGQETSTRAINMSTQRIEDPFGTPESKAILDRWMDFYVNAQAPTEAEVRRRYPRQDGEDEKAYEGAVKYRVFDILRAFLPAGATTNVSWHTNLRQAGDHLTWMLHHPLAEVRLIAREWQAMLRERYPSSGSFGGAAGLSGVGADGQDDERAAWYAKTARRFTYPVSYPKDEPFVSTKVPNGWGFTSTFDKDSIAYLTGPDYEDSIFKDRPRGCVLPHFLTDLGQLRFRFDLDFGSFRDLQRHRNGVCRMPFLTVYNEPNTSPASSFEPWYLEQLPADVRVKAEAFIQVQYNAIATSSKSALYCQYLIPMGFKVPCSVTYGLPAFVYLVELRSKKSVHPTLRTVVHRMIRDFQNAFPHIPLHVDMTEDPWNVRRGTQTIERKL